MGAWFACIFSGMFCSAVPVSTAALLTWPCRPGCSALLAEGLHSVADVANQLLLKHGVIRSRRKPTREHQYGFHKEKYVYALISGAECTMSKDIEL